MKYEIKIKPVEETDSPEVKKIKYETEVANFIFDEILKEAK